MFCFPRTPRSRVGTNKEIRFPKWFRTGWTYVTTSFEYMAPTSHTIISYVTTVVKSWSTRTESPPKIRRFLGVLSHEVDMRQCCMVEMLQTSGCAPSRASLNAQNTVHTALKGGRGCGEGVSEFVCQGPQFASFQWETGLRVFFLGCNWPCRTRCVSSITSLLIVVCVVCVDSM